MEMNNNNPNNNPSSRTDRKIIERDRRNRMKALYSQLNSLIPHHNSREPRSLPDQLGEAANYIKKLQTKLERMRERKESLLLLGGLEKSSSSSTRSGSSSGPKSPEIRIQDMGSSLVIGLTTGFDSQFIFNETIRILHEEGTDVVNASFTVVNDVVYHTIHLTVGEFSSANGRNYAAARISERLTKFVQDIADA